MILSRSSIAMRRDTRPSSSHTFALLTSTPNFHIRKRRGAGGRHNASWSCTEVGGFHRRPHIREHTIIDAGQIVEELQTPPNKSKETICICAWSKKDRLPVSQGGSGSSTSETKSHNEEVAFGHAAQAQKLFCVEVARLLPLHAPRTVRDNSVAHVDVHRITCTAVFGAQTQLELVWVGNGLALHT